jgi:hypothetical protein
LFFHYRFLFYVFTIEVSLSLCIIIDLMIFPVLVVLLDFVLVIEKDSDKKHTVYRRPRKTKTSINRTTRTYKIIVRYSILRSTILTASSITP